MVSMGGNQELPELRMDLVRASRPDRVTNSRWEIVKLAPVILSPAS